MAVAAVRDDSLLSSFLFLTGNAVAAFATSRSSELDVIVDYLLRGAGG